MNSQLTWPYPQVSSHYYHKLEWNLLLHKTEKVILTSQPSTAYKVIIKNSTHCNKESFSSYLPCKPVQLPDMTWFFKTCLGHICFHSLFSINCTLNSYGLRWSSRNLLHLLSLLVKPLICSSNISYGKH